MHPKTDFCSPQSMTQGVSSKGESKENAHSFFEPHKNQTKLSGRNRANLDMIVESTNQLHDILNNTGKNESKTFLRPLHCSQTSDNNTLVYS